MPTEPVIENLDTTDEMIAERRGGGGMPPDMPRWMAAVIMGVDSLSLWVGRVVCWLVVPMFLAMVYEVVARYAFVAPTIWAYDVSRMLYGALFMLGAGYALSKGVHIRADFIYRNWPVRLQGRVDVILYVSLYFPGLIAFFFASADFAWLSWERGETSLDTAWAPIMGPIKTCLPAGVALLLIQGVSELLKSWWAMRKGVWP